MLRSAVRMASSSASSLPAGALYLGLDSSTQGLKATAIDRDFKVVHSSAINFAKDLPHYELKNGVHAKPGNVVTQPTLMVRGRPGEGPALPAAFSLVSLLSLLSPSTPVTTPLAPTAPLHTRTP
jgi:hypothetical protein